MNGQKVQDTAFRISVLAVLLVAPALKGAAAPPASHKVRVRVLDASSGKPVGRLMLGIEWFGESRFPKGNQNEITNSDGEAVFEIPDIDGLRISPVFAPDDMGNCSEVQFSMAKVLESGLVAKNYCGTPKWMNAVAAKPGELLIFGKPRWTKLLRDLFTTRNPPCTEILSAYSHKQLA